MGGALLALMLSLPQMPLLAPDAAFALDPPPLVVQADAARDGGSGSQRVVGGLPTTSMSASTADASADAGSPSRRYINLTGFPFPLGPFFERVTVPTELVKDRVYSFEQEQTLAGITANSRCVVFRMRDNHLLVYNPIAPTAEFLAQLDGLKHDGVSHILLGATQYEHKIFTPPFARQFPKAKVWAVPDQWSFPLDLPAPLLGINTVGTGGGELTDSARGSDAYTNAPDLTSEFEIKLLRPSSRLGFGYAANEAALLHKDTKTLALTDALVNVQRTPAPVYSQSSLFAIGDNARDSSSLGNLILKAAGGVNWRGSGRAEIEQLFTQSDTRGAGSSADQLQRGWERDVLLSLYFGPSPRSIVDPHASFEALADKWITAPVTDTLIYRSDRIRPEITRWVEDVASWDFKLIAPAHFAARPGTPDDLRAAFAPTIAGGSPAGAVVETGKRPYVAGDVQLLDEIAGGLVKVGII